MAVKPILQFRNQDSTLDLNTTQARIVDRAIFDGGTLTPSAVSLQVSIAPFIASGYDGMVAVSDTTENRSVPAPASAGPARVSYLILHLEYRSLTAPIVNLQVVPETTWLTSVSRNFFVTFAKFSIPFGATSLTDPGVVIDYSPGDWADKLGKTGWRMPVATAAALPTTQNRDGDVRIAFDTRLAYAWNALTSTWSPIGGAIDLAEIASRDAESKYQWHRVTSGSGFVNEIPQSTLGTSVSGSAVRTPGSVQFPFIPLGVVANSAILPGCHYLMNGHFIKAHATEIVFPAAPGVGERFDLLFLEVWRETLTLPSSETYDNQGGVPQLFSTVRAALEQMTEAGGTLAASFDLSEMEVYDSTTFVVTRYQYRVAQNVNVSVLTDTSTVAGGILNVDGNAFSVGSNVDQKLWQAAAATTAVDDVSWAIPLMVVRRTSDELAGPPYIDTFRGDERFVFDVAPRAELGTGLIEVEETLAAGALASAESAQFERPDGFITGTNDPIVINNGSLDVPPALVQVMGRRLQWASPVNVLLPAAPASSGRTDLLVLEVFQTAFTPPSPVADAGPELQFRARIGPKSMQWVAKFRFFSLPLGALETTVEGAMTAAAVYSTVAGEPALWSRAADAMVGEDPTSLVWALPVCLVHRRNTTAYAVSAVGQNGADRSAFPGLPNRAATFPYEGELLDVRSRSVSDPEELQRILDESFDKLVAGDLRTNMREHPIATAVSGTQLLQVDLIGPAAAAGTHLIPNVPNGRQTVWSESDEAELFTWSFLNLDIDHTDPTGVFNWTAATNTLGISLPPGYMMSLDGQNPFNPQGPQGYVAYSIDGNVAGDRRPIPMDHAYFSGAVPIGWFIQGDAVTPTPGRQTEVVLTLNGAAAYAEVAAVMLIGVWGVKRNHEAGRSSILNSYTNNRGLFGMPERVHRIDYSLTGIAPYTRAWVGVPLNYIEVPVVGDALVLDRATLYADGTISKDLASVATALNTWAVAGLTLSSTSSLDRVRYIQFTDDAGVLPAFERLRIEFFPGTVPPGTTARITLICTGDLVTSWFEVDPGSKQVRGPYTVAQNQFSFTTSADHKTFESAAGPLCPWSDCGVSVLGGLASGSLATAASSPAVLIPGTTELSYYAAGTANAAYEIWFNAADRDAARNIGSGQSVTLQQAVDVSGVSSLMNIGAYSSMFSLNLAYSGGVFGNHTSVVVAPIRTPLPTGAVARIYYEYIPYQGITSSLETKINGTVEGISDQIVFTSGPNRPWIDYRLLGPGLRRSSQSASPPGTYTLASASGTDLGLIYSKGRVSDRNALQLSDGPTYGGYFITEALTQPYRPEDRPPLALSQRLPFPTKAANGASVGSRYSPESFLSHTALLDEAVVRPVSPTVAYARDEASPWLLEYSAVTSDERMWRSQNALTTLYFPLPVHIGETVVGLTLETESAGPSGFLTCTFVSRSRETGAVTPSTESFYAPVTGPAATRRLQEVSVVPGVLASNAKNEVFLALTCSTSNLMVGLVTVSVVPNTIFSQGSSTIRRYPYNDVRTGNIGKTLRKGMRIDVPSSWTSEFASYEAILVQDGREDFPGVSPARGRALVTSLLGTTSYGAGGMIGYVPGGDINLSTFQLGGYSSAPGFANRETAPRFNQKSRAVMTGATAPDVSAGTALAYIVHTDENAMYMGVSTGYSNITNGTAILRVGQAVDAFYPVGRPVFRRT